MSDLFKPATRPGITVTGMTLIMDALGLTVHDMAASLAFYRRLGLDIPAAADAENHVEVLVAPGMRLMFDTEEVAAAVDPDFTAPGPNQRGRLCFAVRAATAGDVDQTYQALTVPVTPGTCRRSTLSGVSATPRSSTPTGCSSIFTRR